MLSQHLLVGEVTSELSAAAVAAAAAGDNIAKKSQHHLESATKCQDTAAKDAAKVGKSYSILDKGVGARVSSRRDNLATACHGSLTCDMRTMVSY